MANVEQCKPCVGSQGSEFNETCQSKSIDIQLAQLISVKKAIMIKTNKFLKFDTFYRKSTLRPATKIKCSNYFIHFITS